jgi:hypothetical protein
MSTNLLKIFIMLANIMIIEQKKCNLDYHKFCCITMYLVDLQAQYNDHNTLVWKS